MTASALHPAVRCLVQKGRSLDDGSSHRTLLEQLEHTRKALDRSGAGVAVSTPRDLASMSALVDVLLSRPPCRAMRAAREVAMLHVPGAPVPALHVAWGKEPRYRIVVRCSRSVPSPAHPPVEQFDLHLFSHGYSATTPHMCVKNITRAGRKAAAQLVATFVHKNHVFFRYLSKKKVFRA